MGPIGFDELLRLVESRSVTADTWIYHPQQTAWVQAKTIAELTDAMRKAAVGVPPVGVPPEVVFCRFCGTACPARANHCSTCGHSIAAPVAASSKAELAAGLCRTSVLVTAFLPVVPIAVPAIVWASAAGEQAVVSEAKAALNCHIVLAIAWLFASWIAIVGLLFIVGPCIAAVIACAAIAYALVAGVLGLIALGRTQPFEYPLMPRLIR
jgi:uncharacterized Tic20 family protein